ncbi:hypothetical protein [Kitasatospora sp. NPDC018619]|uniref:hypothetical protein n=1 Tax=unclassified Kitasatospora TaxID=2633591 RepID=UPI00378FBE17
MKRTGKNGVVAVAGAVAAVLAVAGAAVAAPAGGGAAAQAPAPAIGEPGTGEILPHPGPAALLWIPDWIGDGGAVTASVNPSLPFTFTLGCRGGGSAEVHIGGEAPADFTVQCPVDSTGLGTVEVPARPGRDLLFSVHTSDPSIHWGMYALQDD